ncbi:MAG: Cna B-type domain-containing protein [Clostridia bacterium]|nr:Cna B-type domain-containing protein [Clostridia bacterium]
MKRFATFAKRTLAATLMLAMLLPALITFSFAIGDTNNSEGSAEKTTVYNVTSSSNKKYYRHSDYRLRYNEGSANYYSFLRTFLLTTKKSTSGAYPNPNNGEGEWSAETAKLANYMVAYCADWRTASVASDADNGQAQYDTLTMDNSRVSNSKNAAAIEGIINNAYPFISEQEMTKRLTAAGIKAGTAPDYIAATQTAIWRLFTQDFPSDHAFNFRGYVGANNSNTQVSQTSDFYPVANKRASATLSNTQMEAIITWLTNQRAPSELSVASYTQSDFLTQNDDSTYTVKITVNMNRDLLDTESVTASVSVGAKTGTEKTITSGKTLEITLSGLEHDEIVQGGVKVNLSAKGRKINVYFFDSAYYQDMISGMKENFDHDLSFNVAKGTKTSVSVSKKWSDNTYSGKPAVTVHLLANGIDTGKSVTLSSSNSWTHMWEDLPTVNALDENITYTVYEDPIPGYYCVASTAAQAPVTRPVWVKQTSGNLTANGTYMFVCDQGALAWEHDSRLSREIFAFESPHVNDYSKTPKNAIWVASGYNNSNGATFSSKQKSSVKFGIGDSTNAIYPTTSSTYQKLVYFYNNKLYIKQNGNRYFNYIYEYDGTTYSGKAATTTTASAGEPFKLYKLQNVAYSANLNYVLTNYQTEEKNEPTTVTIEKIWSGKADGKYPASCTVTLLQNGLPYGDKITLSAENSWSYSFENLPTKNENGEKITYSVKEDFIAFYTPTVTTETTDAGLMVKLENKWSPIEFLGKLIKTDSEDLTLKFENISFSVWQLSEEGDGTQIPGTDKFGWRVDLVTTGLSAQANLNLAAGSTYYIIEENSPFGYSDPDIPTVISVSRSKDGPTWTLISGDAVISDTDSSALLIKNESGYVLPETGGIGNAVFYALGATILLASAIVAFTQKRENEK